MTPTPASPAEQVRAIADIMDDPYEPCGPDFRHAAAPKLRAAAARLDYLTRLGNLEHGEDCEMRHASCTCGALWADPLPSPPAAPAPPETEEM